MQPAPIILITILATSLAASQEPAAPKRPVDFRVFKSDRPVTGLWSFADPTTGARLEVEISEAGGGDRALRGRLRPGGTEVLSLVPKVGGVGYSGSLLDLLKSCGQEKVPITDFLLLGDQVVARLEAKPPETACAFLEDPDTARWFVAASPNPARLRGAGEIASDQVREQIGLGGQPGGPSTPITADAVLVEGGTQMKFRGKVRSMDGSTWIEVEAMASPAVGIEPPRGFLPADSLRIASSISFVRATVSPVP